MRKKIFTTALVVLMCMSAILGGCGNKKDKNESNAKVEEQTLGEYVYVPQFVDTNGMDRFYNMVEKDGFIYTTDYSWDPESGESTQSIIKSELETLKEVSRIEFDGDKIGINTLCVDGDGNVIAITYDYSEGYDSAKQCIAKITPSGEIVKSEELKMPEVDDRYFYISKMMCDSADNVVMVSDDKVYIFDKELSYKGDVSLSDGWVQSMFGDKNGNVYISRYDYSGAEARSVIDKIDATTLSTKTIVETGGIEHATFADENTLLCVESDAIYSFDINKGTKEFLTSFVDCDILQTEVNGIYSLNENEIMVFTSDWQQDGEASVVAKLVKTKRSETQEKEIITIGCLYSDYTIQSAIVNFNRSSDKYRARLITYWDRTSNGYDTAMDEMLTALMSGNCTDIMEIDSIPFEKAVKNGYLLDLSQLFDSTGLKKDDFVKPVIEGYTVDGKLVAIPKSFAVAACAGRKDILNGKENATVSELLELSKEYPDKMLFDYANNEAMLQIMVQYNEGRFVDWTTGECHFDSEEFKDILKLAALFPNDYDYYNSDESEVTRVRNGNTIFYTTYLSNFDEIQLTDFIFNNEEYAITGYPHAEGTTGIFAIPTGALGVYSKSQNVDGAMEFYKYYLTMKDTSSYSFPTYLPAIDEMAAKATEIKYVTDENGKMILDEDGKPIEEERGAGVGFGDISYDYHRVTEDEVKRTMEVINRATVFLTGDNDVFNIIMEEAPAFFNGQKTVDEVVDVIQSRVKVFVRENM